MPANLSIKNVPDATADALRRRAALNRRSLQGELLAIVEAAVDSAPPNGVEAVFEKVRRLGLTERNEAAAIIRADRDAR